MVIIPVLDVDAPTGGIRVMYAMVDALNAAGVPAAIWHGPEGYRCTWFEHDTPVVWGRERRLGAGDVLVVPELGGARYQPLFDRARVVMLNQGHFHTFDGIAWGQAGDGYPGWPNAVAALATSGAIADLLAHAAPRLPVHRLPLFVDPLFLAQTGPKQRVVAMMGKAAVDLHVVGHLLAARLPAAWQVRTVSGLDPAGVASALGEAAIFASFASRDGFSLPGVEAMAAGCVVTGYDGGGAAEYLRAPYAVPTPMQHVVTLSETVVELARTFDTDRAAFDAMAVAGRDLVRARYTRAAFDVEVPAVIGALVDSCGQSGPVTVRHYSAHGDQPAPRDLRSRLRGLATGVRRGPAPSTTPLPVLATVSRAAGVSVVIPHHGDPALATQAAADVLRQSTARALQVIVVDDASPTPFPAMDGVEVVRRAANGGFGSAVNTGAERARHAWLLVVNSDVRMDPDFLDPFVAEAETLQPAVCSPHVEEHGRITATGNHFPRISQEVWGGLAAMRHHPRSADVDVIGLDSACVPGTTTRTDWLVGACLLLPTNLLRGVGGFDEEFHMFAEETELQWRLADHGVPAWYLGRHRVRHAGGASTGGDARWAEVNRSGWLLARKRGYHRAKAAATVSVAVGNLAYNTARRARGRAVAPVAELRRELTTIRDGWLGSRSGGRGAPPRSGPPESRRDARG